MIIQMIGIHAKYLCQMLSIAVTFRYASANLASLGKRWVMKSYTKLLLSDSYPPLKTPSFLLSSDRNGVTHSNAYLYESLIPIMIHFLS